MKSKYIVVAILVVAMLFLIPELDAQCPMCRMSAESNLKDGGTAGKGLNAGILYMLSMPYLLVMGMGYLWWRNKKSQQEDEQHKWN